MFKLYYIQVVLTLQAILSWNYHTINNLGHLNFFSVNIFKNLANFYPNITHSHGKISICILKHSGNKSSRNALKLEFFCQYGREKTYCLSVKKERQFLKNYFAVSLCTICRKTIKSLFLFSKISRLFLKDKLINVYQSGFKLGNSCIKPL